MSGKPQVSYHLLLKPVYSAVLGYSKGSLWNSKDMKYSGYTVSGTSLIYISDCYSVLMTVPDPGRKKNIVSFKSLLFIQSPSIKTPFSKH